MAILQTAGVHYQKQPLQVDELTQTAYLWL